MDDNFIKEWRKAYGIMANYALEQIMKEERKYVEPYFYADLTKPSILRRLTRTFDKVILKIEPEKNIQMSLDYLARSNDTVIATMHKAIKDNPDKADMLTALLKLHVALDFMLSAAGVASKQSLLSFLKDFLEIYRNNPSISDVDAMVQYIQKDGVIKSVESLNYLSQDVRDNLDLGLDEHLKAFVERYAKEYLQEDISLGGMKE